MADTSHREQYIPVRRNELIDLLCKLPGVTAEQQKHWHVISNLMASLFHFEFLRTIEELGEDYAPYDPDRETATLREPAIMDRANLLEKLFSTFSRLMARANFHHVTEEELLDALKGRSRWGLNMDVDFGIFDRLAVYVRGKTTGKRSFRNWKRWWKMEEIEIPIYRRLIIILKLREDSKVRIGPEVNSNAVYIKAFKDIPQEDIEMLLPGAKLKMNNLDKTKLTFPLLTFVLLTFWNVIVVPVLKLVGLAFIKGPVGAGAIGLWGLAAASGTYGYRSYYTYSFTRNQYSLQLTRSLYYQNLDNNAGVLYSLLNEAEQQEWREAILCYFCLWRDPAQQSQTLEQLDGKVEAFLKEHTELHVDFEVTDAVKKLQRLGLVSMSDGRLCYIPLEQAIEKLHDAWEKEFNSAIHKGQA